MASLVSDSLQLSAFPLNYAELAQLNRQPEIDMACD